MPQVHKCHRLALELDNDLQRCMGDAPCKTVNTRLSFDDSVLRDSTDLPFSLLKEVVVQARVMGEVSVLLMGHPGLCRWDEGGDVRLVMTFDS